MESALDVFKKADGDRDNLMSREELKVGFAMDDAGVDTAFKYLDNEEPKDFLSISEFNVNNNIIYEVVELDLNKD